jgi:C-terminal processing protease CtpA/Prc
VSERDTLPETKRLLNRLRANPGRIVQLENSGSSAQPASIIRGPARVGILVDGGTVSAAEAFLVRAMRSTRVTVFGENTSGALDYLSVAIVPFQAEPPNRWLLGYPTMAAHADLPAGGIRGKGIEPQVPLDLETEDDVVGKVEEMLKTSRR